MTKQVSIKGRNGYILRGVVTIPDKTEKVPVLMNVHGFGGNKCGYKNLHVQQGRCK